MPANTPIFILGLAVGTGLFLFGLLLGHWFASRGAPRGEVVDRQQFLTFLRNLTNWTSEFSGDVSKYQTKLTDISKRVQSGEVTPREELVGLLAQIMHANRQLQERLDSAEQKLEVQTDEISNYLTEARTDGLTGLFNRRAFDRAIDELFADWQKKGQSFSLGLIDIDHFKQINDTYGHPAGDAILKLIAGTLQTELHQSVCVARYGGEEFAMLSLASLEDAAAALEHLREVVQDMELVHDEKIIRVTLSAGVSRSEADDKVGKLVRRADEGLYAAKLGGRNRVFLHDGTLCRQVTPVPAETAPQPRNAAELLSSKEAQHIAEKQAKMQERLKRMVEGESQRLAER